MGAILKMSASSKVRSGQPLWADVGMPQVRNFRFRLCLFGCKSGMISGGRDTSACNNIRGPVRAVALGAPQVKWRIICRKAHVSSWFWPWFLQSALAPKKKSRHLLRSLSKFRTPASSKNSARACLPRHGGPVPIPDCARRAAVQVFPKISAALRQCLCALRLVWPMRPADCQDRSKVTC